MLQGVMYDLTTTLLLATCIETLQWKVLVTDQQSRKLIDNVVKEDDILNENITRALDPKMQTVN